LRSQIRVYSKAVGARLSDVGTGKRKASHRLLT
jgi:hypothetical protein